MNAFITAVSSWLPGPPVTNENLDHYLGKANRISAKTRQIILANNGIKSRHYAINPDTGRTTHTNAQLTAEAVRRLFQPESSISEHSIQCLCCGTSTPDQLMPGHGPMVHGELASSQCEVMTTAGICMSGITAMKYGAMSVALGTSENAVATGSELASTFLHTDFFQVMGGRSEPKGNPKENKKTHPAFSFEAEFLRWMLSDGAGAVLIEHKPAPQGISLKIDWIEIISHAHRLETCMYAGAVKQEDGSLKGWREFAREGQVEAGILTIKQDARLLNKEIIRTMVGQSLPAIVTRHGLQPDDVAWFLPHYSSGYFREPLMRELETTGFPIPEERWFTNLATRGNTGAASFFIMLEELFHSGKLQQGERILGMIPESGRFSVGWVLLTVV